MQHFFFKKKEQKNNEVPVALQWVVFCNISTILQKKKKNRMFNSLKYFHVIRICTLMVVHNYSLA